MNKYLVQFVIHQIRISFFIPRNSMKSSIFLNAFLYLVIATLSMKSYSQSNDGPNLPSLALPDYRAIDRHSVNMFTGTVDLNEVDLKIGGPLGLTHSYSSFGGHFAYYGDNHNLWGFRDYFKGGLYGRRWGDFNGVKPEEAINNRDDTSIYVLTAFGLGHSIDFVSRLNDDLSVDYQAFQDQYNTMEYDPDRGYVVTLKDGTEMVYFNLGAFNETSVNAVNPLTAHRNQTVRFPLRQVVYPNGLTIDIDLEGLIWHGIDRVSTNTGFELVYVYEEDNRPNMCGDRVCPQNSRLEDTAHAYNTKSWSLRVPKCIVARNRALGPIDTEENIRCSDFNNVWPKAEYSWPAGMPAAMFRKDAETVFSVTDYMGGVTEYHHKGFEVINEFTHRFARIVGIKPANSEVINQRYTYQPRPEPGLNVSIGGTISRFTYFQDRGMFLSTATRGQLGQETSSYNFPSAHTDERVSGNVIATDYSGNGYQGIITRTLWNGLIQEVTDWGQKTFFELGDKHFQRFNKPNFSYLNNRIRLIQKFDGGIEEFYDYDDRGNITKVLIDSHIEDSTATIENGGLISESIMTAEYPEQCTSVNRKYCNKPFRVAELRRDGAPGSQLWNVTNYHYDEAGNTTLIEYPAKIFGTRHTIHNKYDWFYAYYKNSDAQRVRADTPVSLKTHEISCQASQYSVTDETCSGDDKVVTEYFYNHDNLFLTEMVVTGKNHEGQQESRRTCYYYDIYGNQTGQLSPRADAASCSN